MGSEFQVNTYTTGNQGDPSVAMDSEGDFVVAWQGFGNNGSRYGIYARLYNAAGVAQEASQFLVNTFTTSGNQTAPAVAMDSAGDFVVAWQGIGEAANYNLYAQRYSAGGTPQGSQFQVNASSPGNQMNPAVAMDPEGDFVVSWYWGYYDVYAKEYNASGVSAAGQVAVPNSFADGATSVAMDSQGDFVVAWAQGYGAEYNVYAQQFQPSGTPEGSSFQVNSAQQRRPPRRSASMRPATSSSPGKTTTETASKPSDT